ncbi:hypothetical protein EUX98_g6662 [Antrodiella citrinella]|uniref:Uncharacterized protein n=1 Tax=Antrodiella citrinella TaxID=2447956 RepID=A0A4V3XI20_9APHY|nr:hypothetical protein EUX98_g6662 [Antrodiella citrinella]
MRRNIFKWYGRNSEALLVARSSRCVKCCDAATFGRNHEDVLDEDYRKAGKIDAPNFAATFDLIESVLLPIISERLLSKDTAIRAERYKLNVYGEMA